MLGRASQARQMRAHMEGLGMFFIPHIAWRHLGTRRSRSTFSLCSLHGEDSGSGKGNYSPRITHFICSATCAGQALWRCLWPQQPSFSRPSVDNWLLLPSSRPPAARSIPQARNLLRSFNLLSRSSPYLGRTRRRTMARPSLLKCMIAHCRQRGKRKHSPG